MGFLFPVMLVVAFPFGSARAESQGLRLLSLHTASDINGGRITAVFNKKPDYRIMLLAKPARLVINLPAAQFPPQRGIMPLDGFFRDVRYGMISPERSRMIFTVKSAFRPEYVKAEPLEGQIWRLVIDLAKSSDRDFEAALQALQMPEKTDISGQAEGHVRNNRPFIVVIDAGHGGFDSGAMGVSGVLEKEVTLAFAKALRDHLQKEPGIHAYLTREDDVFLRLNERVAIARRYAADLFVSIHADHIDVDSLRGATVYTLSDKASDTLAKRLAEHENKSDLLDGLPPDEPPEVTDILIDLTRRETHAFSTHFAERVVHSLKKADINLIGNPHRYAGFQVLRAPDIPSVLIELGYLSNAEDEKLISEPQWREKMAQVIASSIRGYADMHRHEASKR